MNIVLLGIEFDGIFVMRELSKHIPAQCVALSSDSYTLKNYGGNCTVKYSDRLPLGEALSRVVPKIEKYIKDADLVFLLSSVTGRRGEDEVCYLAEFLDADTLVNVIWFPQTERKLKRIQNLIDRLRSLTSVIAFDYTKSEDFCTWAYALVSQVVDMYQMSYANADPDTGKRCITNRGLLHIVSRIIKCDHIVRDIGQLAWNMRSVEHCDLQDTLLEYADSVLLHLRIPEGFPEEKLSNILECILFKINDNAEFNLALFVDPTLSDSVIIEVIAGNAVTCTEAAEWMM